MSSDHPELAFVQAAGYTRGRPDGPPLWIVIHDMEAHELPTTAESTAAYFANPGDGRDVSSHYCADNNSVVQCVNLGDVAWTVGNRPGNYRGINWELAGFASQSRDEWLDAFGRAMFSTIAPIIRSDAARFGIPLRRCSIDDLLAYRPGVTSHNDLRVAFGVTDHTDPGPNFPWDLLIPLLNGAVFAPERTDRMFGIKEQSDPSVYVSTGLRRRGGFTWPQFEAMAAAGLLTKPAGNVDYSGWVLIVPDGELDAYAGPLDVVSGSAPGGGATPDEVRAIVDEELDEAFSGGADANG